MRVLVITSPDGDLLSTVVVNDDEVESVTKQIKELDPECEIDEYIAETLEDTLQYLKDIHG